MEKENLIELRNKILNLENMKEVEELLPQMSAYQYLYDCNKRRLDSYALNYLGRKYTFKELFERIDEAAKGFKEKNINEKDVVAMAMLSTPEAIISFYALNKIGATVYMINATHEKSSIREEILDSEAKLLVINDIFYDREIMEFVKESSIENVVASSLNQSMPIAFYGDRIKFKLIEKIKKIGNACDVDEKCIFWDELLKSGKNSNIVINPYYEKNSGIIISSTSGSTGKPKRPLLTNENINSMPVQMGMSCDAFAPNDSILNTLPIWIIYSLFNSIHEPLCLGVRVDLDPLFSSKKISKRFKQYKFNHWNTIPSYVEDMVNDKGMHGMNLSFLKTITTGGDYRSPKLKMRAEELLKQNNSDCEIGQGYGLSETGGCFGYTYERNMPADSLGKPLIGNKYKIVNADNNQILGPNESGELYLYSPAMMKEYYKDSEATKRALIKDENGVVWFKTEDMAHYDEEGLLYLDGRKRRIEISRDANGVPTKVFPDKVKQVISLHPAIEQCEIVMIPDDKRITRPVAYLILKKGFVLDDEILSQINLICIEHNIENYTIPTEYEVIDEMPKSSSSKKVDFDKLKDIYLSSHTTTKSNKVLKLLKQKLG